MQARKFAPNFDVPASFKFSETWCFKFKRRFSIRKLKLCGEKLSADFRAIDGFKEEFFNFLKSHGLTVDQIYNCDESGLFFKMTPRETLTHLGEKNASGIKIDKNRITFMPCSNVSGTHKLPLMVIGRSKKPRCFKNTTIPLYYRGSANAWMNRELFSEWFQQQFVPQVREFLIQRNLQPKAVLLMDNCSAHHCGDAICSDDGLIQALFLPPNVTSIAQPMDQGVIQNIKLIYREKLEMSILSSSETLDKALKKITLKDVVFWLFEAWQEVLSTTITRSWKQIGVVENNNLIDEDEIPLAILFSAPAPEPLLFTPELEEERIAHTQLSDSQIIRIVNGQSERFNESDSNNEDNEDDEWRVVENSSTEIIDLHNSTEQNPHKTAINNLNNTIEWAEKNNLDLAYILSLRKIREIAMRKALD